MNGSINLSYDYNLPVFAHVIMDSYFVYNRIDLIQENKKPCKLIVSMGALCAIAELDINIIRRNEIYVFNTRSASSKESFSSKPDNYMIDGGTVMSIPIQLALQSSPESVYLLGLDIYNANFPRFYEETKNQQKSGLIKDYYSKILPFMVAASNCYKNKSIPLFNCSPISQLPYTVIPYSDIYEK